MIEQRLTHGLSSSKGNEMKKLLGELRVAAKDNKFDKAIKIANELVIFN